MIVHHTAEIERELRHNRVPQTDNVSALIQLGFEPAMPQVRTSTLWTRVVDLGALSHGGGAPQRAQRRVLGLQRAELVALPCNGVRP